MTNIRRAEIGMDEDGNVYVANPSGTKWKPLGGGSQNFIGAFLELASAFGNGTIESWNDTPIVDTDGFTLSVGEGLSNGFTIPSGLGGMYLIVLSLNFTWSSPPTYIKTKIDGTFAPQNPFVVAAPVTYGSAGFSIPLAAQLPVSEGDEIYAVVETSGGDPVPGNIHKQQFSICRLGAL